MRKLTACILCLALCVGIMSGCAPKKQEENVLTMWAGEQWVGSDFDNLDKFINYFNDTNDLGLTVKLTCKSNFAIDFASSINSGRQPDIITWGRFNTPTYVRRGLIAPIDDLITRDKVDTSLFYEETNRELVYEGKQYGLPLDVDTWGIYVNNSMLAAYNASTAGVANPALMPTKWSELLDTAKKLTQRNSKGEIIVSGYSTSDLTDFYFPYLTSTGESMFDSSNNPKYDSDKSKETLNFLKTLKDSNVCVAGKDTKSAFANGMLAMINQPVYYSSYLNENFPEMDYTFIPLPAYDGALGGGSNAGMLGGFSLAMPYPKASLRNDAWSARRDKAWEFMKWWLLNEEHMLEWAKTSNTLPALKSIFDDPFIQNDPVLSVVSEYAPNYKMRPPIPGYYDIQVDVFNREIANFLSGKLNLNELISTMTTQSVDIINRYK